MFKILSLTLLTVVSFAQEPVKTWMQEIASGNGAKPFTTMLLNSQFNKSSKDNDDQSSESKEGGLEFLADSTEDITNSELFTMHRYFHFYKEGTTLYYDEAIKSIKNKKTSEAFTDEKYGKFREFILYGQNNPRLKDLLPDVLINDNDVDQKLLTTLLQDPNPVMRASFARAFWRYQAGIQGRPEDYYKMTKLFLENTNKADLIEAYKHFDKDPLFSEDFKKCNPQLLVASRLITGEKNNKPIIDCPSVQKLQSLSDEDFKKLTTDSAYKNKFWASMTTESDQESKWLQQTINFLVNQTSKTPSSSPKPTDK